MVSKLAFTILVSLITTLGIAQNSLAKIEYAEAETDYQAGKYTESLAHLETVKEMLGSTNAKVMYLEILNRNVFTNRMLEKLTKKIEGMQLKMKFHSNAYLVTEADIQEYKNLEIQLENLIASNKPTFKLDMDYLINLKELDVLIRYYIENFENAVPLDKLTEIYAIHKNTKEDVIEIDKFMKAQQLMDSGNIIDVLPLLNTICNAGNKLACELFEEKNAVNEKRIKHAEVLKNIRDEMVFVEGGTFQMGGDVPRIKKDLQPLPIHKVSVNSFYIAKYEVTKQQYFAITRDMSSDLQSDFPQSGISRDYALLFIAELNALTGLNYRLLTEAEWEFAARGGNKSKGYEYAGSNDIKEVANYEKNSDGNKDRQKGNLKPNELGIYDMSGNLWEFCQDVYSSDYYSISQLDNPKGPDEPGGKYVLRGGSFLSKENECLVYYRHAANDVVLGTAFGLRLALDVK